ncbi:hypothetical protein LCGC14_0236260 [marine sediment metagenome]|uniref:HNH nuclease domain-containing protein n=1 Tax=marine sediment metagenome TaxID=412755 RepID=A0A0F9XDE0_9ZZZZ
MMWSFFEKVEGIDYVVCQVCGRRQKELGMHLTQIHHMTKDSYLKLHLGALIVSQNSHDKRSKANSGRERSPEWISKWLASMKGYKHSEETKRKIGRKSAGRKHSPETLHKMCEAQRKSCLERGLKLCPPKEDLYVSGLIEGEDYVVCRECDKRFQVLTGFHLKTHNITMAEYRRRYPNVSLFSRKICNKQSESQTGRYEDPEERRKLSESHRGVRPSLETLQKLSEINSGERNPNYGKKHSEETKCKMSESHKGIKKSAEARRKISGQNHYNWKGGSSFEPYSLKWTSDLKQSIRDRDNHVCQLCGKSAEKNGKNLDVHHIDEDKMNSNPSNLIAFCSSCHTSFNTRGRPQAFTPLLQAIAAGDQPGCMWKPLLGQKNADVLATMIEGICGQYEMVGV